MAMEQTIKKVGIRTADDAQQALQRYTAALRNAHIFYIQHGVRKAGRIKKVMNRTATPDGWEFMVKNTNSGLMHVLKISDKSYDIKIRKEKGR
jgi:hypothetical protein